MNKKIKFLLMTTILFLLLMIIFETNCNAAENHVKTIFIDKVNTWSDALTIKQTAKLSKSTSLSSFNSGGANYFGSSYPKIEAYYWDGSGWNQFFSYNKKDNSFGGPQNKYGYIKQNSNGELAFKITDETAKNKYNIRICFRYSKTNTDFIDLVYGVKGGNVNSIEATGTLKFNESGSLDVSGMKLEVSYKNSTRTKDTLSGNLISLCSPTKTDIRSTAHDEKVTIKFCNKTYTIDDVKVPAKKSDTTTTTTKPTTTTTTKPTTTTTTKPTTTTTTKPATTTTTKPATTTTTKPATTTTTKPATTTTTKPATTTTTKPATTTTTKPATTTTTTSTTKYSGSLKVGQSLTFNGQGWCLYNSKVSTDKLNSSYAVAFLSKGDEVKIKNIDSNWLNVELKSGKTYFLYYGSEAAKYFTVKSETTSSNTNQGTQTEAKVDVTAGTTGTSLSQTSITSSLIKIIETVIKIVVEIIKNVVLPLISEGMSNFKV